MARSEPFPFFSLAFLLDAEYPVLASSVLSGKYPWVCAKVARSKPANHRPQWTVRKTRDLLLSPL